MAQDPPPAEDDSTVINPELKNLQDEVDRLSLEQKKAEALKAIAEANKAAVAASLPATETKGKTGSVTVDDKAGYFAELMAYSTLSDSACSIDEMLQKEVKGKTVVVTAQVDLSQQAALWELVHLKLGRFQDDFDYLISQFDKQGEPVKKEFQPESVGAAAITLTSLLGAASDIAAFFRVDRELKGRDVTLSERALVADVAGQLEAEEVLVPDLAVAGDRPLVHQIERAQERKAEIAVRLDAISTRLAATEVDREQKKTEWEKLKKEKASADQVAQAKKAFEAAGGTVEKLKRRETRFETVITAFDSFMNALGTAPAAGGKSPLEMVAAVDLVRGNENALLLYLDIASQGAELHISKSAWRSGRVSYIGGSVAVFFLVDQKGLVKMAGSMPRSATSSFEGREGSQKLPEIGWKPLCNPSD